MNTFFVLSLLVAAASAKEILRYDVGDHSHEASGEAGTAVTGTYSLETPEGKTITVKYTADKDGYRAESDALPVAPELPDVPDVPVVPEVKAAPVEAEVKAAPVEAEVKAAPVEAEVKAATEEEAEEEETVLPIIPTAYAGLPFTYGAHPSVYNVLPYAYTHGAIAYSAPVTYTGANFAYNTGALHLAQPAITYIK